MQKVTFNNKLDKEFSRAVRKSVHSYFEKNGISKNATTSMVVKTIVLFTLYLGSYALIMSGWFSLAVMWLLTIVMGIGMAGIGFSVSHDALHGAYSSHKSINTILGLSFDLLGANGYIWKITHNIIHHTYTNIQGHDEDLEVAGFIRLSPHSEYKKIHRIQHILAFFAYSLATFFWVFIKDYKYFFQSELGPYKNKKHPKKEWAILFTTKAFYYTYTLILPLLFLNITWYQLLIGFITLHLTGGLILGIIFQLAHVVEGTDYPLPDTNDKIENHWVIHEMLTTSNFARKNKVLSWYIGGLNYQIEHHLFPQICSIHYPEISPIVEKTAKEFGIPYNHHETFRSAVRSHYRMLKHFGNPDYTFQ
ncbi:MAG TPA: acyl-CoA desaturase [Balneolales bacterium]|nr:acyl-CoA desaturase [Balneolales bacterium]